MLAKNWLGHARSYAQKNEVSLDQKPPFWGKEISWTHNCVTWPTCATFMKMPRKKHSLIGYYEKDLSTCIGLVENYHLQGSKDQIDCQVLKGCWCNLHATWNQWRPLNQFNLGNWSQGNLNGHANKWVSFANHMVWKKV